MYPRTWELKVQIGERLAKEHMSERPIPRVLEFRVQGLRALGLRV